MRQSVPGQNTQLDELQASGSAGVAGKVLGGLLGLLSVPAALEAPEPISAEVVNPPARVKNASALELATFGFSPGTLEESEASALNDLDFGTKKEKSEWHNTAVQELIDKEVFTEKQCESLNGCFSPLVGVFLWNFYGIEDALPSEPDKRKDFLTYAHAFLLGDSPAALPVRQADGAEVPLVADNMSLLTKTGDDLVEWQRRVYAVGTISPETLKKEYPGLGNLEQASERTISEWLRTFDDWKHEERPLQALRNKLHTFYCLQSVVTSDQQDRMFAQFAKTEAQLRTFDRRELKEYLADGLAFDRAQNLEERQRLVSVGEDVLKLIKEHPGFTCIEDIAMYSPTDGPNDKTVWQIEHLEEFGARNYVTLRNTRDPRSFITVGEGEFESALANRTVDALVAEAVERNEREQQAREGLRSVAFPENQEVTYLRVFQRKADPTLAYTYLDSMFFGLGLEHSYGEQITVAQPIFADDPLPEIRKRIREIADQTEGKFCVFLDLYCHGSPEELAFPTAMHGTDLIELVREFPDATFITSSIACFGGGLVDDIHGVVSEDPVVQAGWLSTRARVNLTEKLAEAWKGEVEFTLQNITQPAAYLASGLIETPIAFGQVVEETLKDIDRLGYDTADIRSRLIVFTQTTRRVTNKLATISDNEEESYLAGTPHQRETVKILLDGKPLPIGEVFYRADQEVQGYRDLDGEAIFDGRRAHYNPDADGIFYGDTRETGTV